MKFTFTLDIGSPQGSGGPKGVSPSLHILHCHMATFHVCLVFTSPEAASSRAYLMEPHTASWASQVALVVKNPPANAGDMGSIPGSGRSPEGENSNPLQYFCLENPLDRGTWWVAVHAVAMSQTRLSN